jgi:hypothetical protein
MDCDILIYRYTNTLEKQKPLGYLFAREIIPPRTLRVLLTVYKVFAKWADDGSLWQAFIASVRHLAVEKQLDLRVLHGDGTNTVAKKGAMALASQGTNTRRGSKSSRSSTTMATS